MDKTFYGALLGWLFGWFLLWRLRRLPAPGPGAPGAGAAPGPVTIVIPARNEEASLGLLLADLERVRPPGARVVVVDDHSRDATAAVARRFAFVELRPAPALPEGWVGKSWACHVGAADAPAGTLVFLDADVRIPGDGLVRAVGAQARQGGLLSVQPWHRVTRPYEHLSAPFNVLAVMSTGAAQALPPRHPSGVFGPVLVTGTADYRGVGGHAAIAAEPVDDFALARRYREAGLPTGVYGGHGEFHFRMYPQGLRALLEGWTKNFAFGARSTPLWRLVLAGWWWFTSLSCLTWYHGPFHLQTAILFPLFVVQMAVLYRRVGSFHPLTAPLYPVAHALLGVVLAASLVQTFLLRRVRWRGRTVSYAPRKVS